jgi:hypothetical protein
MCALEARPWRGPPLREETFDQGFVENPHSGRDFRELLGHGGGS